MKRGEEGLDRTIALEPDDACRVRRREVALYRWLEAAKAEDSMCVGGTEPFGAAVWPIGTRLVLVDAGLAPRAEQAEQSRLLDPDHQISLGQRQILERRIDALDDPVAGRQRFGQLSASGAV